MTSNIEWKTYINLDNQPIINRLNKYKVEDHPLKQSVTNVERIPRRILGSQPSTGRTTPVSTPSTLLQPLSDALEGLDPLTQFAIQEIDPLSQMAVEMSITDNAQYETNRNKKREHKKNFDVEPWSSKKHSILTKFTTSEKLTFVTSFLSEGEKDI